MSSPPLPDFLAPGPGFDSGGVDQPVPFVQVQGCLDEHLSQTLHMSAAQGPTEIEDHSEPELDVPSGPPRGFFGSPPAGALSPRGLGPGSSVGSPDFSRGIPSSVPGDAVSEGRWWDQVRDSECEEGPVVDPLESSSIDFASTFRSAVQSQFSLEDRNPLKLPWQMGVFGEIFGSSELELFPSLKRTIPTPLASDEGSHSEAAPAAVKRMRVLDKGVSFASAVKIRVPVS